MALPPVLPHGPLQQLAANLWWVRGGLPFPLYRNMVVFRLGNGDLVLHSAVALDEAGLQALEALGRPAYEIIPHANHQRDAAFYRQRYPQMQVLCPAGERHRLGDRVAIDGLTGDVLPPLGVKVHPVPGARIHEDVYEVPLADGGNALIVNDLFGGMHSNPPSLGGRLMSMIAGAPEGRLGTARIVRLMQVQNMAAIRAFALSLAEVPDLRVITVSHGDPVTDDPAGQLRRFAS
jgi:hypothetical protein